MEDYAESLEEITDIRKGNRNEELTKVERKLYRKYVATLSWLVENCRPDLTVSVLNVARRSCKATLADLKKVNEVVQRVKEKKNKIRFEKLGRRNNLVVTGIGDVHIKYVKKS